MNFSSPPLTRPIYNAARPAHFVQPLGTNTVAEIWNGWLGADYYDERSIAHAIVGAVANGTFPTAYPITLKGMVFDLRGEKVVLPDNVTLEACQVISGQVEFHHGTADAIGSDALVMACGGDATANSTVARAKAYAMTAGATANATVYDAWAYANASGATANATTNGARAYAMASGATANSTAYGAWANATASRATANATAAGAEAYASASGATANATVRGAWAGAGAGGAQANAMASGAMANATDTTDSGAEAGAWAPGSIAIAWDPWTSLKVGQGKTIQYGEFKIVSHNLTHFLSMNTAKQVRAEAAFKVGMAFCDGKDVKQSDSLALFFLSAAHDLKHPQAAFELGELYSKKRLWIRQDARLADHWYAKEPRRELASKYAWM